MMSRLVASISLLLAVSASFMLSPIVGKEIDEATIVFLNATIFDGEQVLENTTVVVRGTKIVAVGSHEPAPEGATIIDCSGKTLLPGLIDSHVHVIDAKSLNNSLAFGVTTVIDMFTDLRTAERLWKEQREGVVTDRSNFVSSGTLATAPGGHGTEYGIAIPTISQPDEAQAFVDARIAEGSEFIKIIYDDGSAYGREIPTISKETLAAIVRAAHARGKMAVVHAGTLQNCLETIEAGADCLAHLYFDNAESPSFGEKAAEAGVFVIPTLTVVRGVFGIPGGAELLKDDSFSSMLSPADVSALQGSFELGPTHPEYYGTTKKALKQLVDAGVPILAGTDAPNPGTAFGASLHMELELLVNAGMNPIDALKAATSVPAEKFGLGDRGRIAPGYRADLLLVEGNPTQTITDTRKINAIWKSGKRFDLAAYRARIAKAKAESEKGNSIPAPEGFESGLVSDFESGDKDSEFGFGWVESTDSYTGGKSKVEIAIVEGGANGSAFSMRIRGEIVPGAPWPWAGALFSPGSYPMSPANLSSKPEISFWARGKGEAYSVMLFSQSRGYIPAMKTFVASEEWEQFTFKFNDFNGLDGSDIMGLFFGGPSKPGAFELQIDEVWFR